MHGEHHFIRICGHSINWHKPIKPYVLVKHTALFLALAFLAMPAMAGDLQPSSLAPASLQTPNVAEKSVTGQAGARDQRTAGSSSLSPAMALAMALGYRNAAGPWEYSPKTMSPSTKDVNRLTGFDRRDALVGRVAENVRTLSKKENIYK
jgi:hypothetical protein